MRIHDKHVLVLVSGGIDSAACIRFYQKMRLQVEGIFIDYGQLSRKKELIAANAIAMHYEINLQKVSINGDRKWSSGLVTARNAVFYLTALMFFAKRKGIIASGIHAGTVYYDCSESFLADMKKVVDGYSNGTIKLDAPFLNFTKKEILAYCKMEKVPVSLTYSCELGIKQPCGRCNTCKDLEELYASTK